MGERARTIAAGAGAAALALVLAVALLDVRPDDFAVPIWYGGDALFTLALTKGLFEHGTILHNPNVGAPYGLDFHDFPYPYGLHLATLRAIGWFTSEPGAAVNALWLLGFPAIAAAAFAALRLLGLPRAESAAAAVLYCFLPYHLARGQAHLFLSMYYLVPLAAALAVRLLRDAPRLAGAPAGGGWRWSPWPRVGPRAAFLAALLALALGASGVYYAFFACFFFAAAGALGALRARSAAPLGAAALLVALVGASELAGVAPSLLHWREHGTNRAVGRRVASEAERYGLKIAPMLLPIPEHPIPGWADIRRSYDERTPILNENGMATLGVVAGAGFLVLVGRALALVGGWRGASPLLDGLAALNLAGLLLATASGFGALVAKLGFPGIRVYARISIWLAFFALAAAIAVAQPLRARLVRRRTGAAAGALLLALVLALALLDVVSSGYLPDRRAIRETVARDRAFVAAAEAALPAGTLVYQLPHVDYPEVQPPGRMDAYDSLRPYLHTRTLRWSHGAMKGRPAAEAIAALAQRPPGALVDALVAAGYGALLVDRLGYDPAAWPALRAELEARLGPPLASDGRRLLLYRLPRAAGEARRSVSRSGAPTSAPADAGSCAPDPAWACASGAGAARAAPPCSPAAARRPS